MFSLSPLITDHPCVFHHTRVRPSTQCYLSFCLSVIRSPGFGSTITNYSALLRLGFPSTPELLSLNLARYRNSQAHSTKGTPSGRSLLPPTCCGRMVSGSLSLPSPGSFSPFPHGTSPLSVTAPYLALDRGRPSFRQGSSSLAVLRLLSHKVCSCFEYGALTLFGRPSHAVLLHSTLISLRGPARPSGQPLLLPTSNSVHLTLVWV